ncbi:hypothetical protein FEDK69T_00660 [Flavobacterium enshiense DK69]|nr:hypothetical protein FEDK69T_00660 [Flavobacterium enshiense DK69]
MPVLYFYNINFDKRAVKTLKILLNQFLNISEIVSHRILFKEYPVLNGT